MEYVTRLNTAMIFCVCALTLSHAQDCRTGKLDPIVSAMLKNMAPDNRTLEELWKAESYKQFRAEGIPSITSPAADAMRIKITADSIPVFVYNPLHRKGLPIIIHYHGGGFFNPVQKWMEPIFSASAKTFEAIVFVVDYRVAPEHKFPTGINDCYKAFKWIVLHGNELGGDTSRIIVKGESSGGNFVAVVCQKALQDGFANKIKLQVMNCPVLDNAENSRSYKSMKENANGYMLTTASILYDLEIYADKRDYNNPAVAPLLSSRLSGLPPAVILTAEFDPLRDIGTAYATKLKKAGVQVWYQCFPGQIHCMIGSEEKTKEADLFVLNAMKNVMDF